MRETLRWWVQPVDSHGATLRSSISRTGSGPSARRRSRMWARNASLSSHHLLRARVAPRPHQVPVQRQVLAQHERCLVCPVLEQGLGPRRRAARAERGVERPQAAEDDEQVVARDHIGGIELQTAQGTADVEDRFTVRPASRRRAFEALRADREPACGGDGQAEHGRATIITGHDGHVCCARSERTPTPGSRSPTSGRSWPGTARRSPCRRRPRGRAAAGLRLGGRAAARRAAARAARWRAGDHQLSALGGERAGDAAARAAAGHRSAALRATRHRGARSARRGARVDRSARCLTRSGSSARVWRGSARCSRSSPSRRCSSPPPERVRGRLRAAGGRGRAGGARSEAPGVRGAARFGVRGRRAACSERTSTPALKGGGSGCQCISASIWEPPLGVVVQKRTA